MSGIVSATVAGTTALAAAAASAFPDTAHLIQPLFAVEQEYVALSAAIVFGVPGLAVLAMLAGAARD